MSVREGNIEPFTQDMRRRRPAPTNAHAHVHTFAFAYAYAPALLMGRSPESPTNEIARPFVVLERADFADFAKTFDFVG